MAGNFDTFLRALRVERMKAGKLGSQPDEECELPRHEFRAPVRGSSPRIGKNGLPGARNKIGRILGQEIMQKRRAAARQTRDKDGLRNLFRKNCGMLLFLGAKP